MILPPRLRSAVIAVAVAQAVACAPPPADGPPVVLITIDTLRADHLGCYGHDRPTSPHADRLAAAGVRFANARAQAPWTLPSMGSLFTSLYPFEHGLQRHDAKLPEVLPTLPEVFADAGYHTAGAVAHRLVTEKYGFASGFEDFDDSSVVTAHESSSEAVTRVALDLLDGAPGDRPVFLWVHYFDPHLDYLEHADTAFTPEQADAGGAFEDAVTWSELRHDPGRLSPAEVERVEALYDSEVAHTDRWLGALLDGLEERGLADRAVIALTSDHGESFREHGHFGHGRWVYDEFLRVPLLLAGALPDSAEPGTVVQHDVELRRLPATLAELAGIDDHPFRGPSLLDDTAGDLPTIAQGNHAWGPEEQSLAIVRDGWKLILPHGEVEGELYELLTDPDELRDRWNDATARTMRDELAQALLQVARTPSAAVGTVELDADEVEHLRQLGYVDD